MKDSPTTDAFSCSVCDTIFAKFETYGIPEKQGKCPNCGAKPRSRALAYALAAIRDSGKGLRQILEIGPSKVNALYLTTPKHIGDAQYTAVDKKPSKFHDEIRAPHRFLLDDAKNLNFASQTFDLIICSHVLAFIKEDHLVLLEIRRLLKDSGVAILNSSLQAGPTQSANEYRELHPEHKEDFYIENGTEWYYGEDYHTRLHQAGLKSRSWQPFVGYSEERLKSQGLRSDEEIILGGRDAELLLKITTRA